MKIVKHYGALSEAIRANRRPQAHGALFKEQAFFLVRSCALGGAFESLTGRFRGVGATEVYRFLSVVYPYLRETKKCCGITVFLDCPDVDCRDIELNLEGMVMHLNDEHKWSKVKISDFVAEYEEKIGFVHLVEGESDVSSSISTNNGAGSNRDSVVSESARYVSTFT